MQRVLKAKHRLLTYVSLGVLAAIPLSAAPIEKGNDVRQTKSANMPVKIAQLTSTKPVVQMNDLLLKGSVAKITAPGDILVVEIDGGSFRSWSISPDSAAPVTTPNFQKVSQSVMTAEGSKPTLTVNVNGAKGAYISVVGNTAPQINVDVIGTFQQNGPATAYPTSVPGSITSAAPNSAMPGDIPDAPMVYIHDGHAAIASLRTGNASAMRGFHKSAVAVARSMHSQLAGANASFLDMTGKHLGASVKLAQLYASKARSFANLAGMSNSNNPDFSLIQNYANLLQSNQQTDSAALQAGANAITGNIPDPKVIIAACNGKVAQLETQAEGLMKEVEAHYPENVDPDTIGESNSINALAERLHNPGADIEQCYINALVQYSALNEGNAPIPNTNEAFYRQLSSDAEAFGGQMANSAAQFEASMDADARENEFSLSPGTMLNFERQLLLTLRSIDTGGEIADEIASLFAPNVSDASELSGSVKRNVLKTAKAAGACSASSFNFNVTGSGLIMGTPWNDSLTGSPSVDVLVGLGGDDCIKGKGGIDLAFGLRGNDEIKGDDNHDFLFGNKGDDIVEGGSGKDYIFTIGAVTFKVWLGNLISGGAGSDTIFGIEDGGSASPGYTDVVFGDGLASASLAGNDVIDGQGGINFVFGQRGNDKVGSDGDGKIVVDGIDVPMGSFLFGNLGDDTFSGSKNMDFAFGGPGADGGGTGDGFDFAFGGKDDDSLSGDKGFDVLFGNSGKDRLEGGIGAGTGTVPLDVELIFGGTDNDTILDAGGLGGMFFGFDGDDIIRLGSGVNLLVGGHGNDLVVGGNNVDLGFGNTGHDTVDGDMGIDLFFGGPGSDKVNGGGGIADLISGGAQRDLVMGASTITTITGTDGTDIAFGNLDNDYVDGEDGIDFAFGDDGDDVVRGGNFIDFVSGMAGNDCVYGDNGMDIALGAVGDDKVRGGSGVDLVMGNAGVDDLFGDEDADLVISDAMSEKIDLGGGLFNLAIGGDGDDDIVGSGGVALSGNGNDRVEFFTSISVAFGGSGSDDIRVPAFSLSLGGDDVDRMTGGALAFGGNANDSIHDARLAFGGSGDDRIKTKSGFALTFGGDGADQISNDSGGDLIFGGPDSDNIFAADGKNFIFGGSSPDLINVYAGTPEPRDFAFGVGSGNSTYRNDSNKKDVRTGGGTSSAPAAPGNPDAVVAAVRAANVCRLPADVKRFEASFGPGKEGNLGSPLVLTLELRDYPKGKGDRP